MIRHRRTAAILLAAALLSGCDSGGSPAAKPTANTQDKWVKFAQCMRQNGINMPDPQPGAGQIQIGAKDTDKTKLDAAMKACKQYNPKGDIDPNDPKQRDHELKMSQCLRRHGVDAPDPQPGQPPEIRVGKGGEEKVKKAEAACRKELGDAGKKE